MIGKKLGKINLFVLFISVTLVVFIPFIFNIKTIASGVEYRGFPFDWLALYPSNGFSFKGLGFLFNVLVFYLLIMLSGKILKKNVKPLK